MIKNIMRVNASDYIKSDNMSVIDIFVRDKLSGI